MTILYILASLALLSGFLGFKEVARITKETDFQVWQAKMSMEDLEESIQTFKIYFK